MAIPKSINLREEGDIDILDMYLNESCSHISIALCQNDRNLISIICNTTKGKNEVVHLLLNKKESKLIIDALVELHPD